MLRIVKYFNPFGLQQGSQEDKPKPPPLVQSNYVFIAMDLQNQLCNNMQTHEAALETKKTSEKFARLSIPTIWVRTNKYGDWHPALDPQNTPLSRVVEKQGYSATESKQFLAALNEIGASTEIYGGVNKSTCVRMSAVQSKEAGTENVWCLNDCSADNVENRSDKNHTMGAATLMRNAGVVTISGKNALKKISQSAPQQSPDFIAANAL